MSKTAYAAVTVLVAILVVAGALFASSRTQPTETPEQNGSQSPETPATSTETGTRTTRVKVALLDYTGTMQGKKRACDVVVMREVEVPATQAPLTAAMRALFATKADEGGGLSSFMPKTAATLTFDRATVENGVARIYLNGSLSGLAGVCDDPRAKSQIEETALQFATVQSVVLYLNGQQTELQPNEKGE